MEVLHLKFILVLFAVFCGEIYSSIHGDRRIICVPHIKTFSTNDDRYYYQCDKPGDTAILMKCPENQFYWAEEEKCFNKTIPSQSRVRRSSTTQTMNPNEKPKIEDRQILGQIVLGLGDLYDAKMDRFLAGTSLWKETTINSSKRRQNQISSSIRYAAGKTLFEKMDEMKISASLKLDFLGGLISISGGADFYRESSSLENEETFNVVYETRSHSEVLPIRTQQDFIQVCASKEATHVVSQVLYGQRGYLSFKHKLSESSKHQTVKGNLQALVRSIFSVSGKASVDLKGSDKRISQSTEVKISGDFILDTMPTSFTDAIQTFKRLASANGKSPQTMLVKPVSVQLTPLWKYCDKTTAILIRISATMIDEVTKVLDNIEKLHIKVKTLLSTRPAIDYIAVRKNLHIYETFLRKYLIQIKGELQQILPKIRAKNGKSEADLNQLIAQYISSPLNFDRSSRFLSRRNREIKAIQYLLDHFDANNQKNIQIADYESANDVDISLRYPKVVIFSVNILQPPKITESFVNGTEIDESYFWFNSVQSVGSVGNQIRLFKDFAAANKNNNNIFYLVKLNKKITTPYDITAIVNSKYIAFRIPPKPQKPTILSVKHDSMTLEVKSPTNSDIKNFYILYWEVMEGESKAKKTSLFNFSLMKLGNLRSATYYQYRIVHYTDFGISPSSDVSDAVMTTPSSPPNNLHVEDLTDKSLQLHWEKPLFVGKNITIGGYRVSLYRNQTIVKIQKLPSNVFSINFMNLLPAEKYTIEAFAMTPVTSIATSSGNVSKQFYSHAATTIGHTLPNPPVTINVVSTDLNSVSITWDEPTIAKDAVLSEYLVKYSTLNTNGSKVIVGTEKFQSALTNLHVTISGLAQGTTYGFNIQVKTSLGTSKYSGMLTARTSYNFTELDKLRNEIERNILLPRLNDLNSSVNADRRHGQDNTMNINIVKQNLMTITRYMFNTSSGLLPFGIYYGDVLQPKGDDIFFKFTTHNNSFLPLLLGTLKTSVQYLTILNDGSIVISNGTSYRRSPTSNNGPVIAGYASDFNTGYSVRGYVYIRSDVKGNSRQIINDDINRYLYLTGKSATFSSNFLLLVTYNNTARYGRSYSRFTFQIAVASDGIRSFAVFNYHRLDENAQYGVGYYNRKCGGWKPLVPNSESRSLTVTTNCNAKGKHVVALTC